MRKIISMAGVFALLLAGCATVPQLDQPFQSPAQIQVEHVVERVECELAQSVHKELADHMKTEKLSQIEWLKRWSARIHLTMIVDNTASLNPGVTLTSPLHNAYATTAGGASLGGTTISAIPQFFTLGLGAGVSTEAVRTEDMEFDLSISELLDRFPTAENRSLDGCHIPGRFLLDDDLGLDDWLNAALAPAYDIPHPILVIGHNTAPGSAGVTIPPLAGC